MYRCQPATGTATLAPVTGTPVTPVLTDTAPLPTVVIDTPAPPATVPASVVELDGAEVQPGFSLIKLADLYRPTGFAFDSDGRMYVTSQDGNVYLLTDEDNDGRYDLGMDAPFEELNHIVHGGDHGYPNCWNEQDQPDCENTFLPVAFFEAHSSANGLDIYDGQNFPARYRWNAFVSIFGSWLKSEAHTGIQRVVLSPKGDTYSSETSWFVRFPQGVMPLLLAFGPGDALYVGDYINDAIYRISYGIP